MSSESKKYVTQHLKAEWMVETTDSPLSRRPERDHKRCERCGKPAAVWVVANPDDPRKRRVIASLCYGCAAKDGEEKDKSLSANG